MAIIRSAPSVTVIMTGSAVTAIISTTAVTVIKTSSTLTVIISTPAVTVRSTVKCRGVNICGFRGASGDGGGSEGGGAVARRGRHFERERDKYLFSFT